MQEAGSLRDALLSDNKQLIELTSKSPMIGSITVSADRQPDFYFAEAARESSRVVVYEKDSKILGDIVLVKRQEYWGGKLALSYTQEICE